VEIRRYRESDRTQLVALWKGAFPNDPPRNEPNRMIDAKLAVDDLIFVAAETGGIIGAAIAGYDGHRGWLYSVAVDDSMRRKRVGSALIRHAVDALRGLGCIKVNLQVRSTNAAVVAFYESLGFEVEERISLGLLL
jgi:ribosomal protein S18 acetylase RimI-like enzyme